jgi:hypothetical protein
MTAIFENLFVLGRPAGGKSELIDFMKKLPPEERAAKYHIGRFEEVDDFPWLFEACEVDDQREARGEGRLHSEKTPEGYTITTPGFRGTLVDRFNAEIAERYLKRPSFYQAGTLLIEFARGRGDGFGQSLGRFRPEILQRAAILYIKVTFEESYRRNTARYRKGLEASILSHKVPDRDMYEYFVENDWEEMTGGATEGWLTPAGVRVPFVSMDNQPESTDAVVLEERYGSALRRLMELRSEVPAR